MTTSNKTDSNKSARSSKSLAKSLSEFFKRDLIAIPLIKKYPHQSSVQRCNRRSATLEFDTASFPNIEYIAGTRLSIYPVNPADQVQAIQHHLIDDLGQTQGVKSNISSDGTATRQGGNKRIKLSEPLATHVKNYGRDSLRIALSHLYDIMTAPSRDCLHLIADHCTNKDHKARLMAIYKSDDTWENWICQGLRTLKTTLDEFNSCHSMSARSLLNQLTVQQPRLYSISSIKSNKRFIAEIIVFEHRFTKSQIAATILNNRERDRLHQIDMQATSIKPQLVNRSPSVHVQRNDTSQRSNKSIRSITSMIPLESPPITTHQVRGVPSYSGPLMSMYATSNLGGSDERARSLNSDVSNRLDQASSRVKSLISLHATNHSEAANVNVEKQYEGLCSNYLLNLNSGAYIICDFVENPRFTLKGNRERPIMMIGQDVGVIAFRTFWQQRGLEYDRAQVFYTMFKDLSPKKFGDIQLVCLTGHRCKVEDLFKKEVEAALTNRVISSATYILRKHFLSLLNSACSNQTGQVKANTNVPQNKVQIESKLLVELGNRIAKLLIESNGCLYTCCDPQMTEAIEILIVESIARGNIGGLSRERAMDLLPKWKGQKSTDTNVNTNIATGNEKFLFTLENPFEKAQIVQEIYDASI